MPSKRDTYAEYVLRLRRIVSDAGLFATDAEIVRFAGRLARLASTHQRACECACTFPDPADGPTWDDRIEAAERRIADLCALRQVRPELQRDPRGATVRVGGHPVPAHGLPARALR